MNAIILSVGDELVLGQTVDTNSAWLSQQLASIGCEIRINADRKRVRARSRLRRGCHLLMVTHRHPQVEGFHGYRSDRWRRTVGGTLAGMAATLQTDAEGGHKLCASF